MATIRFFAEELELTSGSGLGFFGSTFGNSVQVGSYQDTTYITNGAGTVNIASVDNFKFLNTQSGTFNSASSGIPLKSLPNRDAPLNIRFEHATAVKTQNPRVYIYDRTNIANNASGVTTKTAEIIHLSTSQGDPNGSGTHWQTPNGSSYMTLNPSPGVSGFYAGNGSNSAATDFRHDWYVALSASPDSIGSKALFGLFVSLEYL